LACLRLWCSSSTATKAINDSGRGRGRRWGSQRASGRVGGRAGGSGQGWSGEWIDCFLLRTSRVFLSSYAPFLYLHAPSIHIHLPLPICRCPFAVAAVPQAYGHPHPMCVSLASLSQSLSRSSSHPESPSPPPYTIPDKSALMTAFLSRRLSDTTSWHTMSEAKPHTITRTATAHPLFTRQSDGPYVDQMCIWTVNTLSVRCF
jgi:hypothetical protein